MDIELEALRAQLKSAQIEVNCWQNMYKSEVESLQAKNVYLTAMIKEKDNVLKGVIKSFRK